MGFAQDRGSCFTKWVLSLGCGGPQKRYSFPSKDVKEEMGDRGE